MAGSPVPSLPQRVLAAELKRRRLAAGLSREQVAAALEWSGMKPWRIEEARVRVSAGDVRELAKLYDLGDRDTEALVELARRARRRSGWWKGMEPALREGFAAHLELEATAAGIRSYEAQLVPGLWQTEDYARAVLSADCAPASPEEIEQRVQLRMRRQQLWDRGDPPPPAMWAILDEAVLRRPVGGRDVMRRQLERLRETAARPNMTLQVLPFSAGAHTSTHGPFTLFDPQQPDWPVTASTSRPLGTLVEDDPAVIARYTLIFDHLRADALSTGESRALIEEALTLL